MGAMMILLAKLLTVLKVSNSCIFELQSFEHMRDV